MTLNNETNYPFNLSVDKMFKELEQDLIEDPDLFEEIYGKIIPDYFNEKENENED